MNGKGKRALIVGCCNSGHDIAQDFYEKEYDVTMIQRSSTCVISSKAILKIGLAGLYDEQGPPVEDADVAFWSIPSSGLCSLVPFSLPHAISGAPREDLLSEPCPS